MRQRLAEVNILRAIACIAVILIHVSISSVHNLQKESLNIIVLTLILGVSKFAVPGFIFISGLTLFYNYSNKKLNYPSFLKKRLSYVLIPYVVWTIIYYIYNVKQSYYNFSLIFLLEKILRADAIYHLYFILVIVQFYILFGLFKYILKKFNSHAIIIFFFIVNTIFLKFFYVQNLFIQYIFFFILGCYVAINYNQFTYKLTKYKYYICITYIITTLIYSYLFYQHYILQYQVNYIILYWFISSTISILFIYYISLFIYKKKETPLYNTINRISAASFYIYLSHPLAISVSQNYLNKVGYISITGSFIITTIFVFISVIPLSIFYVLLKNKIYPILRKSINR
ncbi:acyltransferase [Desulfolucanica intricata]|uniref:acyltransferase n=1 Tax=Desulfolucanica intricata TaxID=1285191 RepID=UPI000835D805